MVTNKSFYQASRRSDPANKWNREIEERRHHCRHTTPLSASLTLLEGKETRIAAKRFRGIVEDISIGGVRLSIVDPYGFLHGKELIGEKVKLAIAMPQFDYNLVTGGVIHWFRSDARKPGRIFPVGIEFSNISATDLQYLENYLCSNFGDQNLLWDLWSREVKS